MNTTRMKRYGPALALGLAATTALTLLPAAANPVPMKCVEEDPYYFHANGLGGTFDHAAPDSTTPAAQNASFLSATAVSAEWSADFTGTLCGSVDMGFHLAARPETTLFVYVVEEFVGATPSQLVLPAGAVPTDVTSHVIPDVDVTISDTLKIRINPGLATSSTFLYDHENVPAGFTLSTLQPCEANDPHPDCPQ